MSLQSRALRKLKKDNKEKKMQCQISQEKIEFGENRNGQQCQILFSKDQIRWGLKYSFNLMTGDNWF